MVSGDQVERRAGEHRRRWWAAGECKEEEAEEGNWQRQAEQAKATRRKERMRQSAAGYRDDDWDHSRQAGAGRIS